MNEGADAVALTVANTGDRPVQVASHYHFGETNPALDFDREAARGRRLDIAAGTAVRFEPGQSREVRLVPYGGARRVFGFNAKVMGTSDGSFCVAAYALRRRRTAAGITYMSRHASPFDLWKGNLELTSLLVETQFVMAYRTMGLLGLWAAAPGESRRMVDEKGPAFAEAALAASRAAMLGRRPDEIMGAWVRPLRRKTRSNARRLGSRR